MNTYSDKDWEAEHDMRTLAEAEAIMSDSERLAKAKAHAEAQAQALSRQAKSLGASAHPEQKGYHSLGKMRFDSDE